MLRSLRNFIITLLLSGALFGFAAFIASGILIDCLGPMFGITADNDNNAENNNDNSDNIHNGSNTAIDSTSFSMLLINTNYKPSEASSFNPYDVARYPKNENKVSQTINSGSARKIVATDFVLLRGNSTKNQFTYTYLPASLVVNVKGVDITLNDIYRDLGVTFLCRKISAITGLDITHYSIYDIEDVSYVIDYIEGVTYNVPIDILDEDDNIILNKGNNTIKGDSVKKLIEYTRYTGTTQRGQMLTSLIKSMMSKISNKLYRIDIISLHRSSSTKVDTSVTVGNINSLNNLLYTYINSNILDVTYPGSYRTVDGTVYFVPNIHSAIEKFADYR